MSVTKERLEAQFKEDAARIAESEVRALDIGSRLRVLRDRVIVKRFEYQNPHIAVTGIVLQKGLIVAVGYGRRVRRKVRFEQGTGGKVLYFEDGEETGKILPMKVRVGQVVEFSYRNQWEFALEGEKFVQIWQNAIYGVSNDSRSEALLFQQSAGFDRDGNFMSGKETAI
jgi:co-chaperonin GroES (HSP10)